MPTLFVWAIMYIYLNEYIISYSELLYRMYQQSRIMEIYYYLKNTLAELT